MVTLVHKALKKRGFHIYVIMKIVYSKNVIIIRIACFTPSNEVQVTTLDMSATWKVGSKPRECAEDLLDNKHRNDGGKEVSREKDAARHRTPGAASMAAAAYCREWSRPMSMAA